MLRMRLEATQRMVPESKEFTEELMHAYRKMGAAQDAEMATQKLLKKSEASASSLLNQLTSSRSTLDDMKQMMATKDDLLVTCTAQIGVLRKDIDSMHRTLLRREEEAKLLTSKSNLLAQDTDTLKRERARLEADLVTLRNSLKSRDATISELNKSKNELQRTIDAIRSRSTHPSSKAMDSSSSTSSTTYSTNNTAPNNPSVATISSFASATSLRASAPPPSNGNNNTKTLQHNQQVHQHHRSHTTSDLHHDDGGGSSSDPHSHLYSTDGGDIFKLTDGDHNMTTSPPPETNDPLSYGASLRHDEIQRRIESEHSAYLSEGAGQRATELAPGSLGRISPSLTGSGASSGSSSAGPTKEAAPISEKTKRSSTSSLSQLFAPFLPKSLTGGGSSSNNNSASHTSSTSNTSAGNTNGRTQLSRSETPASTHSPILTPPPAGSKPSTTSTYGPPSPTLHQSTPSVGGVGSIFSYTRTTPAPSYSATYTPQEVASMNQQHMRAIDQQQHHNSDASSSTSRIMSQSSPPATGHGIVRSPSNGGTSWRP